MRRSQIAIPALLVLAGLSASPVRAVDTSAIQDKLPLCESCHSKDGISVLPDTPSLAGQPDQFLQWQLVFFRSGSRKSDQMAPIAADLSNDDIRNLGAYFASLSPPLASASDDDAALSERGAKLAAQRRCASCHTDAFVGKQATARIADQREDYLVKALTDYKSGQRVGGGVAAMADVAYTLSDDDIKALAHFMSHFKAPAVAPVAPAAPTKTKTKK